MHLHNEDLELQIRLAELQAEFQTRLTLFFTTLVISVSVLLPLQQFYFSGEKTVGKDYIWMLMIGIVAVSSFALLRFYRKAKSVKRRIGMLRKRYIRRGEMPIHLKPRQVKD